MQIYLYTAKDEQGSSVKGKVEARGTRNAVDILRGKGLVVVDLKPISESGMFSGLQMQFGSISSKDRVAFTQQLATMVDAGLPLPDALGILQAQSSTKFAEVIGDILRSVEGGTTLAQAMREHTDVFSGIYISLVEAGEVSGKLDEVLVRLAEMEERNQEFKAEVKGAMIYPVIVLVAMVLVMVLMLTVVVPQLTEIYDSFDAELPLMTQVVMAMSDFMISFWWLGLAGLGAMAYGLNAYYKTKFGRELIDKKVLELPIIGNLMMNMILSELTRTLSLMVSAGISILEALDIVAKSTSNSVIREALKTSAKGVEKGQPLAVMLARSQVFPPLVPQMVSVGEETGKLDEILKKVSNYFQKEAEHATKNLTTAIEPIILIVMGVGVGFLVFSILMPIYNLTELF